jgi:hypothetical protein
MDRLSNCLTFWIRSGVGARRTVAVPRGDRRAHQWNSIEPHGGCCCGRRSSLRRPRTGFGCSQSGALKPSPSCRQRASRKSHPCLAVSCAARNFATSSEYEAEANQLRAQIGVTMGALRSGLTPSNLASEAASRVGIADLSWRGAFDYASKRHPVAASLDPRPRF